MNRIRILTAIPLLTLTVSLHAQKFTTDKSLVLFFSHAPIEDIKAENKKSSALFEARSGDIAFVVPVAEFQFEKSLMQEHFNEKYMETERYPKSTFQGQVTGYDISSTQKQNVTVKGKLTIHGVTKPVEVNGQLEKRDDKLMMDAVFIVKLQDYDVQIPQLLWKNIAQQVEVTVSFTLKHQ